MKKKRKKKSAKNNDLRIALLVFGFCFIISIAAFLVKNSFHTDDVFAAISSDWQYRKSITLSRPSVAVTNYQMKILVGYDAADGGTVDCNSNCQTDFDDLRFTNLVGTELDYWIESISGSYLATVWVEFDSIGINATTFYMYYGNAAATAVSNQFTTGIVQLKEHDVYASYNPDFSWSTASGKLKESSGTTSMGSGYMFTVVPRTWINGKYLRFTWNGYYSSTSAKSFYCQIRSGAILRSNSSYFPENGSVGGSLLQSVYTESAYGTWGPYTRDVLVNIGDGPGDVTILFWYNDAYVSQSFYLDLDLAEINTSSGGSGNIASIDFSKVVNMEVTGGLADYGLYRNYLTSEPSWGTWGIEENLGSLISVSPNSLEFGTVLVGSYLEDILTVSNNGTGNLIGSASVLSPFSCVGDCSYNLAAGSSKDITIRFTPSVSGESNGSVTFTGGGGASINVSGTGTDVTACQDNHNVFGYAWSDNLGGISFNCKNCDLDNNGYIDSGSCGGDNINTVSVDYGVDIDNSNPDAEEWDLSGYAWSEYFGWVTFDSGDLSSMTCPGDMPDCNRAWIDRNDREFYGAARICSVFESRCSGILKDDSERGGWDGWIGLNTPLSQVTLDQSVSPAEFDGWAWGGNIVSGWISFNHENCDSDGDGVSDAGNYSCPIGNIVGDYAVTTTVVFNNGPSAIISEDPTEDHCLIGDGVTFNWQYVDDEAQQIGLNLRINTVHTDDPESDFLFERNEDDVNCGQLTCSNNQHFMVGDGDPGSLEFDTEYYWWVNVTNADGLSSGWIEAPTTFTTQAGPYPSVDFSWSPINPAINDLIDFTFTGDAYDLSPTFSWHFGASATPLISDEENPTVSYSAGGDKTITLTVDNGFGSCIETKTITATLPLPGWEEIPPEI